MTARERFMRMVYEGACDRELAEYATEQCWPELAQPETLDRFVRAARSQPELWAAAATNAVYQLANISQRSRRL